MSPTLLEALIVIILIVLGWQIGIQLAPVVLHHWKSAQRQLDQIDQPGDQACQQPPSVGHVLSSRKESNDEQASRTEQPDPPHVA